tara:strand:- start:377 stop:970 length:594 start_codon:yes stop_codon:yes gene_type:complete
MKKLLTLLVCIFYATTAYSDITQENVSGGNTSIQGGYTTSTTYESGSSSSSTTTNSTTSNIRSAPPTASAPGLTPSGIDVCSVSASAGVQTFGLGLSGGKSFRDKNCERIKLSRELRANGMNVAAVALLCQDPRVFQSMEMAGTPCPIDGKIGKQAKAQWKKYGKLRPDYDIYVKRLKVIEDAENNSTTSTYSDADE